MLKKLNYDEVYNRFKEKGLLLFDKEYLRRKNNNSFVAARQFITKIHRILK